MLRGYSSTSFGPGLEIRPLCLTGTRLSLRCHCIRLCCAAWIRNRIERVKHEPCEDLCNAGIVKPVDPSC